MGPLAARTVCVKDTVRKNKGYVACKRQVQNLQTLSNEGSGQAA